MDLKAAEKLIKLARKSIEYFNLTGMRYSEPAPEEFKKNSGAFVTLHSFPEHELRGCIGIPKPIMPLWDAVIEAATGACRDPRFEPVLSMKNIVVELSILSEPRKIDNENAVKEIEIGKHGIIIERGFYSGLLLPQVAVEYSWDAETFLQNACLKASLPRNAWKLKSTSIYIFEAEVFEEKEPNGKVIKKSF